MSREEICRYLTQKVVDRLDRVFYLLRKEGASMKSDVEEKRNARTLSLAYRATPEAKEMLDKLVAHVSANLGARVSRSQALEVAVREAVERREVSRA